jgi:hypothetical protein
MAFSKMACMSPVAASLLNRSTDSNARWPLRSPGAMTSMDTYWSLSGSSPSSSGSTSKVIGPRYWGCSCTISLANWVLIGLATREVGDADLLDRHGCLLGQVSQQA